MTLAKSGEIAAQIMIPILLSQFFTACQYIDDRTQQFNS